VIVADASAMIEWLLQTRTGGRVQERILSTVEEVHAPHVLDLEVAQVLRRYVAAGVISPTVSQEALRDLMDLGILRHSHDLFLWRIWELRNNLTAYDAAYVALAEALDSPLVTCDRKLAAASGHRARIELIASG
jgi:predicted nucleic acid-binding protein